VMDRIVARHPENIPSLHRRQLLALSVYCSVCGVPDPA
jgi:hypothetical protein